MSRAAGIRTVLAALVTLGTVAPLGAQTTIVGTEPDKSPFQSIIDPTRVGAFGGLLFVTDNGPGVTPKSPIPIVGVRYDYHVAGPTYFNASLATGHTTRTILDYNRSAATRNIGEKNTWLMALDVGFDIAPTGDRTWKGIQPLAHLGAALVALVLFLDFLLAHAQVAIEAALLANQIDDTPGQNRRGGFPKDSGERAAGDRQHPRPGHRRERLAQHHGGEDARHHRCRAAHQRIGERHRAPAVGLGDQELGGFRVARDDLGARRAPRGDVPGRSRQRQPDGRRAQ